MTQNLDQVWADLYFDLQATFAEMKQATSWPAHFESTDVGPKITTATFDRCWLTRQDRTEVICTMQLNSPGEGREEHTFRFRLDATADAPVIRLDGEIETAETTASAARYLLDTFRGLTG
jgi:hypothetical protein